MKKIQEQLKKLKNEDVLQARPSWVLQNKQLLMSQIAKTTVEVTTQKQTKTIANSFKRFSHIYQMFVPTNLNKAFRPVLTTILALALTTGGWVASAYAEPGDFMWSTKVALNSVVEQGKLALTPEERKTSVKLDFATKRAQVLQQVANSDISDQGVKNKLLKETSTDLQNQLDGVSVSLQKSSPQDASGLVKEISLKTKEISNTLKDVAAQTAQGNADLSKDLSEQAKNASKQSLQMVEVVLEKKAEAHSEVSDEEKMIIKDHLTDVVAEIKKETEQIKEQANQLKDVANSGTLDLPEDSATKDKVVSSTGETDSIITATTSTSSTIDKVLSTDTKPLNSADLVTKVNGVAQTVNNENNDVNKLVDSNALEAVKQTLQLKATVTDVSKEVNSTLLGQQVQTQANIDKASTISPTVTTTTTTNGQLNTSVSSTIK